MRHEMTEPYSFKKRRPVATATTTTTTAATRLAAFQQVPRPKIENRIVRTTSTKSRLTACLFGQFKITVLFTFIVSF